MKYTEKLIDKTKELLQAALSKGIKPWSAPFMGKAIANHGFESITPYRGSNAVLTAIWAALKGYTSTIWITYGRFLELQKKNPKMRMKAGSKAVDILKPTVRKAKDEFGNVKLNEETGEEITYTSFSALSVFNADCFTGYDFSEVKEKDKNYAILPSCEGAERLLLSAYKNPPKVMHDVSGRAFYRPSTDEIHLPPFEEFVSVSEFVSTLAHELAHSTGAKHRLNRKLEYDKDSVNFRQYDFEELVAEITASIVCVNLGIFVDTIDNSASYLAGWSKSLSENVDWFFKAFSYAEKAFCMLSGKEAQETEDKQEKTA